MKYLSRLALVLSCLALVASPAFAQGYGPARTSSAAVAGTTTGAGTAFSAAGSTAALVYVYSAASPGTSSGTVKIEFSLDGTTYFPAATAVITDPTSAGEMWQCSAAPFMRTNITAHASGTITGKISFRTMQSDPIVGCKKIDTFGGFTFATGTGAFNVSTGKTAAITQSLTFAGTDSTTMTFPTTNATIARTDAANTFTGTHTFGQIVDSGLTATRIPYAGASGLLQDLANFTYVTATGAMTNTAGTAPSISTNRFLSTGSAPTVTGGSSTCGTTAASIVGKDQVGKVTVGSVGGTACVVTFNVAFANAPACTVSTATATDMKVATTTTTLTATATFGAGEVFSYVCLAY